MNLGLKAALPLLDFWEAIMPVLSPGNPGAAEAPASAAGGTPTKWISPRLVGADLFETYSPGPRATLHLFEDNESTIKVIEKGASQKLGTLGTNPSSQPSLDVGCRFG